MSRTVHRNIVYLKSKKIEKRSLIEEYCKIAETLPAKQKILFCLYYQYEYSTIEIGELLEIHNTSVGRRLKTIVKKIEKIKNEKTLNNN